MGKVCEFSLSDFSILEMNNEEGEAVINVQGGLVHPDSVIQEFTKIGEAIPVYSSLDGMEVKIFLNMILYEPRR